MSATMPAADALARYREVAQRDVVRLAGAVLRAESKLGPGGLFDGPCAPRREAWSAMVALAGAVVRQQQGASR